MFNFLNLIQTFTPKDAISKQKIRINKGSCVRQRFKNAECQRCFEVCPSGALSWHDGNLLWHENQCQNCLLCVAVCPVGAFCADEVSFVSLLKKLQEADAPVVGCRGQSTTQGHARVPCLGFFANNELLLALSMALKKPLQLNVTQCQKCRNRGVIDYLEDSVRSLPAGIRVTLVFNRECLNFKERQCNRREFMTAFRGGAKQPTRSLADQIQVSKAPANYRSKRLPLTRSLLLQILSLYSGSGEFLEDCFWPRVAFDTSCHGCRSCTTICPTGALSKTSQTDEPPLFSPRNCVACKLCEKLCKHSAIHITRI